MKVYFIPGLGADKRVFRHIQLPKGCDMVHLDWLPPQAEESLSSYAARLAAGIDHEKEWALVGLSFGGMLASEISHRFRPAKTVLISTAAHSSQLPVYFRKLAPLQLHRVLPIGLFKNASLAKRIFTTETTADKELLRRIIRESDPAFIRWALGAIVQWESRYPPQHHIHIHGNKDRLLPIRYCQPTHIIENAGHLLVMNRADALNRILGEIFAA